MTKFVVYCANRTGSGHLMSLLSSHCRIKVYGEAFNPYPGQYAADLGSLLSANNLHYPEKSILDWIFGSYPQLIQAAGFKLLYYQATPPVLQYLETMPDLKVIHLKRRNLLRVFVSMKVALSTEQWHLPLESSTVNRSVLIDPEECSNYLFYLKNKMNSRIGAHEELEIWYEELDQSLQFILEYLGMTNVKLMSYLRKQNPQPLADMIGNYNELRVHFRGSEYEKFFEE